MGIQVPLFVGLVQASRSWNKHANKVCKLQRSIYGLVQASRSWNKRFDSVIKAFGLYRLLEKPVFTRK